MSVKLYTSVIHNYKSPFIPAKENNITKYTENLIFECRVYAVAIEHNDCEISPETITSDSRLSLDGNYIVQVGMAIHKPK